MGLDPTSRPRARPRFNVLAFGFVALAACLVLLGSIAEDVRNQEASFLDTVATPLLHGLANPTLDEVMSALTDLGSTIIVVPVLVAAIAWLLWQGYRRHAVFLAVAVVGSFVLNETLKLIFHRPRPQLAWATIVPEYSFPSGHAMNSLVVYGALAVIVWAIAGRRAGVIAAFVAVALAVLIGISRIYLGYHYLTDVVGGLLAGALWLALVAATIAGRGWLRPAP